MNELIKNRLSNTKINWENHPFPYAIIDNFLPDEVFKKITDGLYMKPHMYQMETSHQYSGMRISQSEKQFVTIIISKWQTHHRQQHAQGLQQLSEDNTPTETTLKIKRCGT